MSSSVPHPSPRSSASPGRTSRISPSPGRPDVFLRKSASPGLLDKTPRNTPSPRRIEKVIKKSIPSQGSPAGVYKTPRNTPSPGRIEKKKNTPSPSKFKNNVQMITSSGRTKLLAITSTISPNQQDKPYHKISALSVNKTRSSSSPNRVLRNSPARIKDECFEPVEDINDISELIDQEAMNFKQEMESKNLEVNKIKKKKGRPFKWENRNKQCKTAVNRNIIAVKPGHKKLRKLSVESKDSKSSENSASSHKLTYSVAQEVLARWSDGLCYLGTILKVDEGAKKCYIKFEDQSEYWALFRHIQKGSKGEEIICCLCHGEVSESPNEIVLCDNCGLGYHQSCHHPVIQSEVLTPDVPWMCRHCVFAAAAKRGGAARTGPEAEAFLAMKQQSLPYDHTVLTWDNSHKSNKEEYYCYCAGPGDWFMKMLQCCRCRQWFHEACIQCLEKPLLYGDRFYIFVCSVCNSGPEYTRRLDMKWLDVVHLALFNLSIINSKKYYDLENTLLPWIHQHWDRFQLGQLDSVPKSERDQYLVDELIRNKTKFKSGKEIKKKVTLWGLRTRLPPQAPHVILPCDGPITDDVLNNLQMKGRKTKTFVPFESSPIPVRYGAKRVRRNLDDSLELKSNKRTRLEEVEACSSNQSYSGYSGDITRYSLVSNHDADYSDNDEDSASQHSTLEYFIPRPRTYEGHNHPFKFPVEKYEEIERKKIKRKLLDSYQNGDTETEGTNETQDDESDHVESSSLKCVELPPPSKGHYSPCYNYSHLGPPKLSPMVPLKKKRGRKKRSEVLVEQVQKARQEYLQNMDQSPRRNSSLQDLNFNKIKRKNDSTMDVDLQHLQSSMSKYFGISNHISHGQGFRVLGKRMTPDGKLQYLIEWEGLTN